MSAPQGIVRVQQENGVLKVQVEGWATMGLSLPLRRFAEQSLQQGTQALQIDLTQCSHFDSTFLGTLFILKRAAERRPDGKFALIAPSPACVKLFAQMGVADVFTLLVPSDDGRCEWQVLGPTGEVVDVQRNVLQAHQELANLGGKSGEIFRPVAQCLARDMEAKQEAQR